MVNEFCQSAESCQDTPRSLAPLTHPSFPPLPCRRADIEAHVECGFSEDVILKDYHDGQSLSIAELNVRLHPFIAVRTSLAAGSCLDTIASSWQGELLPLLRTEQTP